MKQLTKTKENYIFNNYFISFYSLDYILYNYFMQIIISHITILYNRKENKLKRRKTIICKFSNLDTFLLLVESRKKKLII